MEKEEIIMHLKNAERNLIIADHLTYKTYPIIKEPKLLVKVAQDIYLSLNTCMNAILGYDELYKRIYSLPSDFHSRLRVFKDKCARLHNIDIEIVNVIEDLHNFLKKYKESSTTFVRNRDYIVCSNDFKLETLNYGKIKDYLAKSKVFLTNANKVLSYDIRISR